LKEGETYYWCACGLSKNQPFCDGSHKGTEFVPKEFAHSKPTGDEFLCGCKHNKDESKPNCDGSHKNIDW
jgi:CDGSH-type Zn-finger protein